MFAFARLEKVLAISVDSETTDVWTSPTACKFCGERDIKRERYKASDSRLLTYLLALSINLNRCARNWGMRDATGKVNFLSNSAQGN